MGLRLALPCVVLTLLVLLIVAADADGGTYQVRECRNNAPQNHQHEGSSERLPDPGAYTVSAGSSVCGQADNDYALRIYPENYALSGQYGRVRFESPAGTEFVGVTLGAKLRAEAGHTARLEVTDSDGSPKTLFGYGSSGPAGWAPYSFDAGNGPGYDEFIATLNCADSPGCPLVGGGGLSKTFVRDILFEVRDFTPPTVELSDRLVTEEWARGSLPLTVDAEDVGGGVRHAVGVVNGDIALPTRTYGCALIPGTSSGTQLEPCGDRQGFTEPLNTAVAPFQEGKNTLTACATDFGSGANLGCEVETIHVDNLAPEVAFADSQRRSDPELITARVTDATSGLDTPTASIAYRAEGAAKWTGLPTDVGGGSMTARINSEAHEPGLYEFRATIRDVAGNKATTTNRADGSVMALRFPLKEDVSLKALLGNGADSQTVGYRNEGGISGRLRAPTGDPIAGEDVTVVETFADGSLIEEQVRTFETNRDGRYSAVLHGGPSRDVEVRYEGSRRYRGAAAGGLDFDVRGKARLRTSKRRVRAGNRIKFFGAVKRHRAQIPKGGKLVEVQVKTGGGWTTLAEATGTDQRGKIETSHKFRGFYTQPVTFVFRLKVTRESGWPYRGSATSKRRKVTVVPKSR